MRAAPSIAIAILVACAGCKKPAPPGANDVWKIEELSFTPTGGTRIVFDGTRFTEQGREAILAPSSQAVFRVVVKRPDPKGNPGDVLCRTEARADAAKPVPAAVPVDERNPPRFELVVRSPCDAQLAEGAVEVTYQEGSRENVAQITWVHAPKKAVAFPAFAGFSKDGRSFAWIDKGVVAESKLRFRKKISVGETAPAMQSQYDEDAGALGVEGFTATRAPVPAEVSVIASLGATPPKLSIQRAGHSVDVPVGSAPYPDTDVAELWGVSADGKHVAVHIAGPDVAGLLSKGGGSDLHFVFVAPIP